MLYATIPNLKGGLFDLRIQKNFHISLKIILKKKSQFPIISICGKKVQNLGFRLSAFYKLESHPNLIVHNHLSHFYISHAHSSRKMAKALTLFLLLLSFITVFAQEFSELVSLPRIEVLPQDHHSPTPAPHPIEKPIHSPKQPPVHPPHHYKSPIPTPHSHSPTHPSHHHRHHHHSSLSDSCTSSFSSLS